MENNDNLVLEHLRHIRERVDQIAEDMGDLKHRMSGLEQAMTLVKREINLSEKTDARQQITLDKLAERIGRIERRLELS
jgi:outer membrane murein-binding lipoprotein Lpp